MARRAVGSVSRLSRGSDRRKTAWAQGPGGTTETAVNATQSIITGSGTALAIEEATLVRLRGAFSMNIETLVNVGERMTGAFGIGVVTKQAFDVGITAVPSPLDEQLWDGWIFWKPIQLAGYNVSPQFGNAGSTRVAFDVDTKAMRKLRFEDVIYGIIQVVENGTVLANAFFDSRILLMLP